MESLCTLDLSDVRQMAALERKTTLEGDSLALELVETYQKTDTALGFIRSAILLDRLEGSFETAKTEALKQARIRSRNTLTEWFIDSVQTWFESKQFQFSGQVNANHWKIQHLQHLLEQVRTLADSSVLRLEVQWRIMLALCHHYRFCNELEAALTLCYQMMSLAKLIGEDRLIFNSRLQLADTLNLSGQLHDALEHQLALAGEEHILRSVRQCSQLDAAFLLANLGQPHRALSMLQQVDFRQEDTLSPRRFVQTLYGYLPWDHTPLPLEWASVRWFTVAFSLLTHHASLDPVRTRESDRSAVLEGIIQIELPAVIPSSLPEALLTRWVRAYSFFLKGQYALTSTHLPVQAPPEQELLLRGLFLGLKLELYLLPGHYETEPLETTLTEARNWFELGKKLTHASLEGLHEVMWRWCPHGACFLHLLLGSPNETSACWASVVVPKGGGRIYDLTLPTPYLHEQILREFNLLDRVGAAPLNGRMIEQRKALRVLRGEVEFWRPVVLPHKLIYGLLKSAQFLGQARALADSFGFIVSTPSPYGRAELNLLEGGFRKWLEGSIQAQGFAEHLRVAQRY